MESYNRGPEVQKSSLSTAQPKPNNNAFFIFENLVDWTLMIGFPLAPVEEDDVSLRNV